MSFVRIYLRVLALLRPVARLAVSLALANIALAAAQFVEPVLFGRIVDALSGALPSGVGPAARALAPLVGAWVGFGLFVIFAATLVAWYADRLSHRRRNMVLADYFEHVLQLPLAYHAGAHSGRQMKVMLTGTDTLWWLWLSFFREHLRPPSSSSPAAAGHAGAELAARFAADRVVPGVHGISPFSSFRNRSRCSARSSGIIPILPRPPPTRSAMSRWCRATPASSSKCRGCEPGELALRAQMPVLSWWAIATVLTRAGTTLTLLVILLIGTYLKLVGLASVGQIVSFMAHRGDADHPARAGGQLLQPAVHGRAEARRLLRRARHRARGARPPGAIDPGRVRGLVEFKDVSFSYDGKRSAVADLSFTALPGDRVALVGPTGSGKSTALALLYRAFDPQSGAIAVDGMDIRDLTLSGLRHNIGVVFQETLLFNRSIAENLRVGKPDASDDELRAPAARAQALEFIDRNPDGLQRGSASAAGSCPAANGSGSRSRARC